MAETYRVGLLGHGTVVAAFEQLLSERAEQIAHVTGARPEVSGVLTRSRGDFEQIRRSVMDVLMELPPETRVLPGHTDETTIGREWEENPFIRVWRGAEPEGTEPVRVGDEEATLVVWSPDYDGKGKAWVRFDDGTDAIVGGSRVERG